MYKNYAFRTNAVICIIIIIGFSITSIIGYRSNVDTLKKEAESVTRLASEGMMYQIDAIFAQSIHISLTMAHDSFLINFLSQEKGNLNNAEYTQKIKEYLSAYKNKYNYDSVFLVSPQTDRYYNFHGIARIIDHSNPENNWVNTFLSSDKEYDLNIDKDKSAHDTITVFVNCSVKNSQGKAVGIVGVGFKVNTIQAMLASYERSFSVKTYLTDTTGSIQIASTAGETDNLFTNPAYADIRNRLRKDSLTSNGIWYSSRETNGYAITRYLPAPNLYLTTDKNTSELIRHIRNKYYTGAVIVMLTMILVIGIVTTIIRRYKNKIISLTVAEELKYHSILQNATSQLYENIIEFDITNNIPCGEATKNYLLSLGLKPATTYSKMLDTIAKEHVHPDHAAAYRTMFSPQNIVAALERQQSRLQCTFLFTLEGGDYAWFRETAYILRWAENNSVHIVICRQNIDQEKRQELELEEKAQKDGLTGLYNKMTTESLIDARLAAPENAPNVYALVMFDIDNFKELNDSLGHAAGDRIIQEFARDIRAAFSPDDFVGRVGGDEFIVLARQDGKDSLRPHLETLCRGIREAARGERGEHHIAASIGVALFPQHGSNFAELYDKADIALYRAKQTGKNTVVIFAEGSGATDSAQ